MPTAIDGLFSEALTSQNNSTCQELLTKLQEHYDQNTNVLPDQTKDLYYKLFIALENARKQQQLSALSYTSSSMVSFLRKMFYLSGTS